MGLGMVLAVEKEQAATIIKALEGAGETAYLAGYVEEGEKGVAVC
jgi:Phosphoribosylaminoimidazole (AIR) synthetase